MTQRTAIALPFIYVIIVILGACGGSKKSLSTSEALLVSNNYSEVFIEACTQKEIGNTETALKLFKKCVELNKEEAIAYFELSKLYQQLNNEELSLQNAIKAYQLSPQNVYVSLNYAWLLKRSRNIDLALEVLTNSFEKNPNDEQLVKELDDLYKQKNEFTKAIEGWKTHQKAVGYKLKNTLRMIELYKALNDYTAAHALYDEIKKASPGKVKYYLDDAKLYEQQKDIKNAMLNYEKAMDINPQDFEINYQLYKYSVENKQKEKSAKFLNNAVADTKTGFQTKTKLFSYIYQQYEKDTAFLSELNQCIAALKRFPNKEGAFYFTIANIYDKVKSMDSALYYYKVAYQMNPNLYEAWTGAIKQAEGLQDWTLMASICKEAIEYYPSLPYFHHQWAFASIQNKQYPEAMDIIKTGSTLYLKSDENTITESYLLGLAYYKSQKWEEAIKILKSALVLGPNNAKINETLGDVYYKMGNNEEYLSYWKKALENDANNVRLQQKVKNKKNVE
jgi:tetratricopeptide (TPR) repeat protein